MTRARTENPCDFRISQKGAHNCPADQMNYSVQFSQKMPYGEGVKGKITSSKNRADLCKACFIASTQGSNYKIEWEAIVKQDDGTWKKEAIEAQATI